MILLLETTLDLPYNVLSLGLFVAEWSKVILLLETTLDLPYNVLSLGLFVAEWRKVILLLETTLDLPYDVLSLGLFVAEWRKVILLLETTLDLPYDVLSLGLFVLFALITVLHFIQLVVALDLLSIQCDRCITVDDIVIMDGKSHNSFIFTYCFCQPSYIKSQRPYQSDTLTR